MPAQSNHMAQGLLAFRTLHLPSVAVEIIARSFCCAVGF